MTGPRNAASSSRTRAVPEQDIRDKPPGRTRRARAATSTSSDPSRIPHTLAHLAVPIGTLQHYGRNPRIGNVDVIAESLEANGQYRPIVANSRTNEVLAGNHTLRAARQLGWTEIAATFVDADDQLAARIVAVDNRSNDLASYDDRALLDLLRSIDELAGTGYDEAALAALEALLADAPEGNTDPDDVPPEPAKPHTKAGQVWLLGPHRLAIGNSTDPGVIGEALGGRPAQIVITDPPYNVDYTGKTKDQLQIEGDAQADAQFAEFLGAAYAAMFEHTIAGGPIYVFHADTETVNFRTQLLDAGWLLKQNLIWVKQHFVMGRQDYHWQHEPILYGWKPGAAHRWFGGFTPATIIADDQTPPAKMTKAELLEIVEAAYAQTTALRADRPAKSTDHPTAKPVALLARLLENSSRPGDTVLDPFAGSGSTLLAAHVTRRTAALVELDPRYADVTCRRYQEHTGQRPVLEHTGKPHDFTR